MPLSIHGIRHHGPGSARSLLQALNESPPDIVLVEGPPDAAGVLPLMADPSIRFPIALLVYAPDEPRKAAFYPFAEYSPETIALRWALYRDVPVRFMDLPIAHQMTEAEGDESEEGEPEPQPARRDPLSWLAEAAGYDDSERWWEDLVEYRRDAAGLFAAILEAMTALRAELDSNSPRAGSEALHEARREAYMRQTIRAAVKEGFQNIAVVCGAWHAPALAETLPGKYSAKEDAALLKGLPKTKVAATWVPWTNDRLGLHSGYGAGVVSPGWYAHLWNHREQVSPTWMARAARLLREEGLDASSAHLIEAVRLAEALAAFRGRPHPGLEEMNEAVLTVLCFGDETPLKLIRRKLIVGEDMGTVPEDAPAPPLQQDLSREQKRLRLAMDGGQRVLDLDLRQPNDLDRSRLFHRLRILGIDWATPQPGGMGKGTFHEYWNLQWRPELAIRLIEAGRWGNTVASAALNRAGERASQASTLADLTGLLQQVLNADLAEAVPAVVAALEAKSALTSDAAELMAALPPLARTLRYGDVRGTRAAGVEHLLHGLGERLFINLGPACSSLDDDAAMAMKTHIDAAHSAFSLLEHPGLTTEWHQTLRSLSDRDTLHGLLGGRLTRLLLDSRAIEEEAAATRLAVALSVGQDPEHGAAWIEGFLGNSGLLLLHDDRLWNTIDSWVSSLSAEAFVPLLPLLRRTFGEFPAAERRQLGERVAAGPGTTPAQTTSQELDMTRALKVLPVLRLILGEAQPCAEVSA